LIEINPTRSDPHGWDNRGSEVVFTLPILLVVALLVVIFPFLLGELMFASLSKLHLTPSIALACVIGIFFGGLINIPIKSVVRESDVIEDPLAVYGLGGLLPQLRRVRRTTTIAVNVGGCLIPAALAFYEFVYLAESGLFGLAAAAAGCVVNVVVCILLPDRSPASASPCRPLSHLLLRPSWRYGWRLIPRHRLPLSSALSAR
jgi:uncharacterized membrane protein